MYTPENIEELKEYEIIVVGTNMAGSHGGGAARFAHERFGLVDGVGEGLSGQTYAFPTLNKDFSKREISQMIYSKAKLYHVAYENPDKTFLVTKVGCGIAGFSFEEMREVFAGLVPYNVILPKEFS